MWTASGFIIIICYAMYEEAVDEQGAILTESGLSILTEDNKNILVES